VKGMIGRADSTLPNRCASEALSITRGDTVIGQSARGRQVIPEKKKIQAKKCPERVFQCFN